MKKILLSILLLYAAAGFAQLDLEQPPVLTMCDSGSDGAEIVDLTQFEQIVLNGLDPELYDVTYYTTGSNAETMSNPILTPQLHLALVGNTIVFIRVTDTNDSTNYGITQQWVTIVSPPPAGQAPDRFVFETPFDGVAQFDLQQQTPYILQMAAGGVVTYYTTLANLSSGANPIPAALPFTNTSNPQTIYARVEDPVTGCWSYSTFGLSVVEGVDEILVFPDPNFKAAIIADGYDLNDDGEISTSEAVLVGELNVSNSGITDITGVNYFTNLQYFNCSNNNISAVSMTTSATQSVTANFNNNPIASLNLNGSYGWLTFSNTQLETLDLSHCYYTYFHATNNPLLQSINIKNGSEVEYPLECYLNNNPNLVLVCTDETESEAFLANDSFDNVSVSSYCSFTPGGEYNMITGTARFDFNNNGCDAADSDNYIKLHLQGPAGVSGDSFTDISGNYNFYVGAGSHTITPQFENNGIFTVTPASATVNFTGMGNVQTQPFCITANGVHPDLEVAVSPYWMSQPGFASSYSVVIKNKGNQVLSGAVTFGFDDAIMDFLWANPAQSSTAAGTVTWDFANLLPFESKTYIVTLHLNGPMETPPVNIGNVLTLTASVPVTGDDTPADNAFTLHQTVVGSWDPNNIICLEGETVAPAQIGQYLHYVVNFENTGTAPASFIVVKHDINPDDYDVNSLQVMGSSHPVMAKVTSNKAEFVFNAINLGASDHGNILFKLKSRNTLQPNDSVLSRADIYFDYNYPVITNDAITTFQLLSRADFGQDRVSIYPNPTTGIINIETASAIEKVELYDIQGRLLQLHQGASEKLDLSGRAKGIYFVKVSTSKGVKTEKIVLD